MIGARHSRSSRSVRAETGNPYHMHNRATRRCRRARGAARKTARPEAERTPKRQTRYASSLTSQGGCLRCAQTPPEPEAVGELHAALDDVLAERWIDGYRGQSH